MDVPNSNEEPLIPILQTADLPTEREPPTGGATSPFTLLSPRGHHVHAPKYTSKKKRKDGQRELYAGHIQHRLVYSADIDDRYVCNKCNHKIIDVADGHLGCNDCNYHMCTQCADTEDPVQKKGEYDIHLNILGGCWNMDLVTPIKVKVAVRIQLDGYTVESLKNKIWTESPEIINGEQTNENPADNDVLYLEGAITEPMKFRIKNLPLSKLKELQLQLVVSDPLSKRPFTIEIKEFNEMAEKLESEMSLKRAVRYWHYVPFKPSKDFYHSRIIDDKRDNYLSCKVPQLYADDEALGFLNIECKVNGYDEPSLGQSSSLIGNLNMDSTKLTSIKEEGLFMLKAVSKKTEKAKPNLIDDIEIVKMIVRNRTTWARFSKFLTADVYKSSFEIYLSRNWRNLVPVCVEVMESLNKELIDKERPGNWSLVESQCQEIVTKILDYVPEVEGDIYNQMWLEVKPHEDDGPYTSIVHNELKVFFEPRCFL
jgi:hypothetical protein